MNRKRLLAVAAASTIAGGAICHLATSERYRCADQTLTAPKEISRELKQLDIKEKNKELADKLLKSLSKYEPWVERIFDLDYTDRRKTGVMFAVCDVPIFEAIKGKEKEKLGHYASLAFEMESVFDPNTFTILMQEPWEGRIDHEIGHSISTDGERVGMQVYGYYGPTDASIREVVALRSKKAFADGAIPKIRQTNLDLSRAAGILAPFEDERLSLAAIDTVIRGHPQQVDASVFAGLESRLEELKKSFSDDMESAYKVETLYYETVDRFMATDPVKSHRRTICPSYFEATDAKMADLKKGLADIPRLSGSYSQIAQFNREASAVLSIELKKGGIRKDIPGLEDNKRKMEELFSYATSEQEVFAQMFESLMAVHLGEDCVQLYDLSDLELDMFSLMRDYGDMMFGKPVVKYLLAREMVKDGMTPAEAKRSIEFAESFEYKGRKYEWKTPHLVIKGDVAMVKAYEDLKAFGEPDRSPQRLDIDMNNGRF